MKHRNGALLLIVIILNSGCATHYLWTESQTSSFCEPARDARLRVFEAPKDRDLLAVYSEVNDHNDAVTRRAYLVIANAPRIGEARRPWFVDPDVALTLRPVPLRVSTNSMTSLIPEPSPGDRAETGWVATSTPDQQRFSLFKNGVYHGTYDLPAYEDGSNVARRL